MSKKSSKKNNNKKTENKPTISGMPMAGMPKLPAGMSMPSPPGGLLGMGNKPLPKPEAPKIDIEKIKDKLEDLKKKIVKKYKFTRSLSILPPTAAKFFEEEEGVPPEVSKTNPIHFLMIMPEDQYKNMKKIKPEIVKMANESGENVWVHIKTEIDLWNYGLDGRYEFIDAISASFPLYDNGFLGSLRVANIHKTLVLKKFEKYVASYVIAGSLVRGTADETSDVDTFVIIDDTDVKRMPRLQLLERLRGIIYDYIREASALAGVKNVLNVQVYLLTDFWQSVKDAQPVMFTFIRDGIPMYDRGTFTPWKLLLKMGKIKPSPEAIDSYMKQGEKTEEYAKRRLMDAMIDLYYGMLTPTQAMMMLAGEAPHVPKVIVEEAKKVLVDREKLMTMDDLKKLERVVKMFKAYEHGKLKKVSGKEIDEIMEDYKEYTKMLKGLRKKLESQMSQKSADEIYKEVFKLLKTVLGNKSQDKLVREFEKELVKKGKLRPKLASVLKNLVSAKKKIKAGKLNAKESDRVKRDARELIDALVEYGQRTELVCTEKGTMLLTYDNGHKKAELVLMGDGNNYIIEGKDNIRKIEKDKFKKVKAEDFEKAMSEHKGKLTTKVSADVFEMLKKELGDFELEF